MIDYIKVQILDPNINELERNKHLNFCNEVNVSTGELRAKNNNTKTSISCKNAFYNGLEFRIYESGSVYTMGSLHKYWNEGKHNFNDFDLTALETVLDDIKEKFNISPHQMKLRQLEIGLNFIPPCPTAKILKHCFLHKTTPFVCRYNSDEGKFIEAEHIQYIIKIYDKARHYRKKGFNVSALEITRFEIKYLKLEKLKKFNIKTLKDLLNFGLINFIDTLIEEWQNVLFYDFTIHSESKLLLKYNNPLYWHEIKDRRSAYYKHKRQLDELTKKHSKQIGLEIENRIRQKCEELTNRGTHIDQSLHTSKKSKGTQIDTLYIRSKRVPDQSEKRVCLLTKINISMQKDNSFLLSHTGLKYYFETDYKIFNQVRRAYLSNIWKYADIDTQIKEIAHNIRNHHNNRRLKQIRLYPPGQMKLFSS